MRFEAVARHLPCLLSAPYLLQNDNMDSAATYNAPHAILHITITII